jgi:hypothetical protein
MLEYVKRIPGKQFLRKILECKQEDNEVKGDKIKDGL